MLIIRNIYINEEKATKFNEFRDMKGTEIKARYGYQPGIFLSERVSSGPEMEAEFRVVICEEDKPYTEVVLIKNGEEVFHEVHLQPKGKVNAEEDIFEFDYEKGEYLFSVIILREFENEEDAKQYAIEHFRGGEIFRAKIKGEIVLLSGRYNPYKRYFNRFVEDVIWERLNCPEIDVSELSDKFVETFENYCGMRLVYSEERKRTMWWERIQNNEDKNDES